MVSTGSHWEGCVGAVLIVSVVMLLLGPVYYNNNCVELKQRRIYIKQHRLTPNCNPRWVRVFLHKYLRDEENTALSSQLLFIALLVCISLEAPFCRLSPKIEALRQRQPIYPVKKNIIMFISTL